MTGPLHALDEVGALLSEVAALVEPELERAISSEVRLVEDVGRHTLRAGGKRLRPAFVFLAARAAGGETAEERLVRLGACLELVHMATLIHDDVIDRAPLRRGRATAASLFGNAASILAGDVLLAKAMAILADDGDLSIIRTVSAAVVEMAEGETLEVASRGNFDLPADEHLRIVRMKTASFVECCCRVGALAAGAPAAVVDALGAYGATLGMAFQIVDDLLDYRGRPEVTGKPTGSDFREGCATLPLISLRPRLTEEELGFARLKFGNGVSDEEIALIVKWMEERGAFGEAAACARSYAERATEALRGVPEGWPRDALSQAVSFVIERQR